MDQFTVVSNAAWQRICVVIVPSSRLVAIFCGLALGSYSGYSLAESPVAFQAIREKPFETLGASLFSDKKTGASIGTYSTYREAFSAILTRTENADSYSEAGTVWRIVRSGPSGTKLWVVVATFLGAAQHDVEVADFDDEVDAKRCARNLDDEFGLGSRVDRSGAIRPKAWYTVKRRISTAREFEDGVLSLLVEANQGSTPTSRVLNHLAKDLTQYAASMRRVDGSTPNKVIGQPQEFEIVMACVNTLKCAGEAQAHVESEHRKMIEDFDNVQPSETSLRAAGRISLSESENLKEDQKLRSTVATTPVQVLRKICDGNNAIQPRLYPLDSTAKLLRIWVRSRTLEGVKQLGVLAESLGTDRRAWLSLRRIGNLVDDPKIAGNLRDNLPADQVMTKLYKKIRDQYPAEILSDEELVLLCVTEGSPGGCGIPCMLPSANLNR